MGSRVPADLLAAHVRLMVGAREVCNLERTVRVAARYTGKAPGSAEVWQARLEAELMMGCERLEETWAEARRNISGDGDDAEKIWLWHMQGEERLDVWQVGLVIYYGWSIKFRAGATKGKHGTRSCESARRVIDRVRNAAVIEAKKERG